MIPTGVSCAICTDIFKNSEDISSTNCGHLFHTTCIGQWRLRSSSCPQCRQQYIMLHKMFLNFEQTPSTNDKEYSQLKTQLDQAIINTSLLQQHLDNNEHDLFEVQALLSSKEDVIKELNTKIEYLSIQNENRLKDIKTKAIEIHKLQQTLNKSNSSEAYLILQENNVLKQKFDTVAVQLEKEIKHSIELTADNMKLKSILKHLQNEQGETRTQQQKRNDEQQKLYKKHSNNNNNRTDSKSINRNNGCVQSVIIKNVETQVRDESALREFIMNLIKIMNLTLINDDIENVSVFKSKSLKNITLLVKFSSTVHKCIFISKKSLLKKNSTTANLIIYEYLDDNTNSLLHYAKILKHHGYKHIFCNNSNVFIRKEGESNAIRITSKNDVDKLIRKSLHVTTTDLTP